jgi:hypothetical protein
MKFLLFLFIIVLLIQFIKHLLLKEGFDNNCFHNFKPNFTLKMSEFLKLDENGELSLNDEGYAEISGNIKGSNNMNILYQDLSNNLYGDISAILESPFQNSFLNEETCKFSY